MRRLLCLAVALASFGTISPAQTITTQTFGTGATAFTMEFVTIGNPNNAADTTGSPNPAGSVAYTYSIGKYEVSREQIDKANSAGSLGLTMYDMTGYGGNGGSKPATGITWYEAAKYVNWLNTSTGGVAAYKFSGSTFQLWSAGDAGYNANNLFRNSLAKYWLPSTHEWYKAAYYKGGGANAGYWNFATQSDTAPGAVTGGTAVDTAVYSQPVNQGPADISNAGGSSAYGTLGQGGNVWEWTDTFSGQGWTENGDVDFMELRGGYWGSLLGGVFNSAGDAGMSGFGGIESDGIANGYVGMDEAPSIGFRVASIPEPSSLSLLALGGVVVGLIRRKRT